MFARSLFLWRPPRVLHLVIVWTLQKVRHENNWRHTLRDLRWVIRGPSRVRSREVFHEATEYVGSWRTAVLFVAATSACGPQFSKGSPFPRKISRSVISSQWSKALLEGRGFRQESWDHEPCCVVLVVNDRAGFGTENDLHEAARRREPIPQQQLSKLPNGRQCRQRRSCVTGRAMFLAVVFLEFLLVSRQKILKYVTQQQD